MSRRRFIKEDFISDRHGLVFLVDRTRTARRGEYSMTSTGLARVVTDTPVLWQAGCHPLLASLRYSVPGLPIFKLNEVVDHTRSFSRAEMIEAYKQGTKDGRFRTSNETEDECVSRNANEYVDGVTFDHQLPDGFELEFEEREYGHVDNFDEPHGFAEFPVVNNRNEIVPIFDEEKEEE